MHLCNMEQQQKDQMDSSSWKDKRSKGHNLPQFYEHNVSDGADMKAINREMALDGNNEESEKSLDVYLKLQVLCRHGKDWGACWDTRERAAGSSNVNMGVRQRFVRVHSMLWDKHADG